MRKLVYKAVIKIGLLVLCFMGCLTFLMGLKLFIGGMDIYFSAVVITIYPPLGATILWTVGSCMTTLGAVVMLFTASKIEEKSTRK